MKRMIVMMTLIVGVCSVASAVPSTATVPEIDPGSGMSALALVSGAVVLFRGRRKQ